MSVRPDESHLTTIEARALDDLIVMRTYLAGIGQAVAPFSPAAFLLGGIDFMLCGLGKTIDPAWQPARYDLPPYHEE